MTEMEHDFDFLVAELEYENKLVRARNERLARELDSAFKEIARLKAALDLFIGTKPKEHGDKASY